MKNIKFNKLLLLLSLLIANTLVISYTSKSVANTKELLSKNLQLKSINNSLARKNDRRNKSGNFKNNKSSDQQLVGTWSSKSVSDSGENITNTIMYSPDGNFVRIVTRGNGDWYFYTTATWKLTGNTLSYENRETGENSQGLVKFPSDNEFIYTTDNEEADWQRVDINPNLSKDQLIGTWSITVQNRIGEFFIDGSLGKNVATLIELNSDGTFRYKSIDAGFIGLSDIVTTKASGTWTYTNSGHVDGLFVLKDSQGNLFSVSSMNWSEDGSFININRSSYDRDNNKYDPGRIEEFKRSNLIIDQTF